MKKKDIIFVLEQEIKWCKKSKDMLIKGPTGIMVENYKAGFIGGLEQATS